MAIGTLLLAIAVVLMVEMKGLLIGESARPHDERAICAAVEATPAIRSVIHMRTQHLGPDDLLVGVKIEIDPHADMLAVADTINAAERAIREAVPAARLIYVEPDVRPIEEAGTA
jgi:divalent metal cation (Fe/Co/Zn/Cd) transporter